MELTMEPLEEQISERLTHEIYRLVQETLINAARHAHASAVQVQLSMRDNQVHIVVADNGGGYPFRGRYDLAALTGRKLGPVSLQERIVSLEGGLPLTRPSPVRVWKSPCR